MDYPYNYPASTDQLEWTIRDSALGFKQHKNSCTPYQLAEIKSKAPEEMRDMMVHYLQELQDSVNLNTTDEEIAEYVEYLKKVLNKGVKKYLEAILYSSAAFSIMLLPKSKVTADILDKYLDNKKFYFGDENDFLVKYIYDLMHERFNNNTIKKLVCRTQHPNFANALRYRKMLSRDEWVECLKFYSPFQFSLVEEPYTLTKEEAFDVVKAQPRRYEELQRFQKQQEFLEIYSKALPGLMTNPSHIDRVPRNLVTPELYKILLKAYPTPDQLISSFHHSSMKKSVNSPLDYISYDELLEYLTAAIRNSEDDVPLLLSCTFRKKHTMPGKLLTDLVDIFLVERPSKGVKYMRFIGDNVLRTLLKQRNFDKDTRNAIISYFMSLIWGCSVEDKELIKSITRSGILNDLEFKEIINSAKRINLALLSCRKDPMPITTAKELNIVLSENSTANCIGSEIIDSKTAVDLSPDEFKKFIKNFSKPSLLKYSNKTSAKYLYKHFGHKMFTDLIYATGKKDTIQMYSLICGAGRYVVNDLRIVKVIADDTEMYGLRNGSVFAINPDLLCNNEQEFIKIINACFETYDHEFDKDSLNRFLKKFDVDKIPDSVKVILALKGNLKYTLSIE